MSNVKVINLSDFDINQNTGFLPSPPLVDSNFLNMLQPWQRLCSNMPKLLAAGVFRSSVSKLYLIEPPQLSQKADDLMMRMLSFIASAYRWENWREKPESSLLSNIAVPLCKVAKRLGRPPILSYKSYALDNWMLINPNGPIELGNICLIQNFLGGMDEEWFILPHVAIEARAGLAIRAIVLAQEAVCKNDPSLMLESLTMMAISLEQMYKTLCRIPENCDPYIYYNRVRPYIHGFDKNPVVYEGVAEYKGEPQRFHGETGAQSSIVPSLDAALGIVHADNHLSHYVTEMMDYMPPKHKKFIQAVAEGPSIRQYVELNANFLPQLLVKFNESVSLLKLFRDKHLEYAATYIFKQGQASPHNPTEHGTGGTPFMPYLKQHSDETR